MSDKVNNQEQPVPKKQISTFWYIIGAAAILMIVYQSGRSSGIRSMLETVERTATAPTAAVPTAAANPQPVNSQPDARHIQRSPRSLENNTEPANGGRPANTVPEHLARPASLPHVKIRRCEHPHRSERRTRLLSRLLQPLTVDRRLLRPA